MVSYPLLEYSVTPNTCLYHNNMSGRAERVVSRVWYDSVPLSFPSLAVRKSGESLVSFLIWAWRNQKMAKLCRTNRLCFEFCSTDYTLNAWCIQHSPPTRTQLNTFYQPFYPDVISREKRYQALSHFSVLQATESWAGPENKAELAKLKHFWVKGHHIFTSASRPGNAFTCAREPADCHRPHTVFVRLSSVGRVPDVLAPAFWLPWWMLVR